MKVFRFRVDGGEVAIPLSSIQTVSVQKSPKLASEDEEYSVKVVCGALHNEIFHFSDKTEALTKYKEIVESMEELT